MKKALIALVSALLMAAIAAANTLVVARVHSGDLVEFEGGWTTRLSGITVPGRSHPIGWKAYDFTKRQLEGKRVALSTLTRDNTAATIVRDSDGRPFGTIQFGRDLETDIAVLLLERGFARVDEEHLPVSLDYYRDIEREARHSKIGLWADSERE